MGRAIDMEKSIDNLKIRVKELENIVRGMTHTISERKNIDIIEETKQEKPDDAKKKTNNETSSNSNKQPNKRARKNKK